MTDFILSGPTLYTSDGILQDADLVVRQGLIEDIVPKDKLKADLVFPASYHLIPGFIDLHVHGANGYDVMDATHEALAGMSQALAEEGVTSYLATTMTAPVAELEKVISVVRDYRAKDQVHGAMLLGLHLEGPFISPEKAGAQHKAHCSLPNLEQMAAWQQLADECIKIVTLAPELSGSNALIRYLTSHNILAAIGHSNATYAETLQAMEEGCQYVTHLFNAMRGLHQREPGVVTAALLSQKVWTEIIADGVHLHPAIIQLLMKVKRQEKIILITDAMRAKCMSDGIYKLGGQDVAVNQGVARLADGTLAGSVLRMPTAVKNMMDYTGCRFYDAVKMASENPARAIQVFDKKGSIALDKDADLVVLDANFQVVLTICRGTIVFNRMLRKSCSPEKV